VESRYIKRQVLLVISDSFTTGICVESRYIKRQVLLIIRDCITHVESRYSREGGQSASAIMSCYNNGLLHF
jgi:hypothetical protein